MSDESSQENSADKELKVLRAVKMVITNVIKDTTTDPGMKHPLSDVTINDIRQCLAPAPDRATPPEARPARQHNGGTDRQSRLSHRP